MELDGRKLPPMLIGIRDLENMIGLGRSSIYRNIAAGIFPKPVALGTGSVRWRYDDVKSWADSLQPASV